MCLADDIPDLPDDVSQYEEVPGESAKLKSSAYKSFFLLYDKGAYVGLVKCRSCAKVIKHNIHESGTTHLSRHTSTHSTDNKNAPPTTQTKVTSFLAPKRKLNEQDQTALVSAASMYCARDIRPYSAVEGPGLRQLIQTAISIGSKYGNLPAEDILPSRTTVASYCHQAAQEGRTKLVETINDFIAQHGIIGVTTDMWTEAYKKKNFVSVTVHMLEKKRLTSRTLQVIFAASPKLTAYGRLT